VAKAAQNAKTLAHVVEIDGTHNINGQYGDATRAIQRMLLIRERSVTSEPVVQAINEPFRAGQGIHASRQ
jgi:hypothetical protein